MAYSFDPGALLGRFFPLEGGARVGLRLARPRDAAAIGGLLESRGLGELEVARLVNYDPRRRYVLVATALVDGAERLEGLGSIALGEGSEPEVVVVAPSAPAGLNALLVGALAGRASALARSRAA